MPALRAQALRGKAKWGVSSRGNRYAPKRNLATATEFLAIVVAVLSLGKFGGSTAPRAMLNKCGFAAITGIEQGTARSTSRLPSRRAPLPLQRRLAFTADYA